MRLAAALLILAGAARASSVSNEVSATSTEATDTNPRAGGLADSFNASLDLSDQWSLNFGAALSAESASPALDRGQFGSSGALVSSFSLGADYMPSDHWTFGLEGSFSPQSTQATGTTVPITANGAVTADARLRSQTGQDEAGIDVAYDTAGESDLEWSFGAGISTTHLDTDQAITAIRTQNGTTYTLTQLRTLCKGGAKTCTRALQAAIRPETNVTLDSQKLDGSVTAIVSRDTDLTLSGAFYIYDQDPAAVGYYSVAAAGRVGNGLPLAPLQWTLRPEVTHRWSAFSARLWVTFGQYVAGTGDATGGAGVKLQYRFTKQFRMWTTLSGQRDTDEQGTESRSGTLAVGAGYRF